MRFRRASPAAIGFSANSTQLNQILAGSTTPAKKIGLHRAGQHEARVSSLRASWLWLGMVSRPNRCGNLGDFMSTALEIKDIYGTVIFALEGAKTVLEVVKAAIEAKKSLRDANLSDANLSGA